MDPIDMAGERLKRALSRLEGALDTLFEQVGDPALAAREQDLMIADRARLAEELDAALARETALQELADEASAALGSAIEEVRAALAREEE